MKWSLFFFLLALAAAVLSFWGLQDPGLIKITWLGYDIRVSVIAGFLILIFSICILFLLKFGISWLLGIPFRWVSFLREIQERKASATLIDFLSSFEAENLSQALHHQKKGARFLAKDPFFLWISGNVFEKAEKPFEAEKCFMDLAQRPSTLFLGLKGQIRAALHRRDFQFAQALLERAEKIVPNSPWVLNHLLALAREKKDFKKAEELLLHLEDLGYLPPDKSKRQIAYIHYLEAIQPDVSLTQKEVLLRKCHGLDPNLTKATEALAQLLNDQGKRKEALQILETAWLLTPCQTLGDLYLKLTSPKDGIEAYQFAEQLIKHHPKASESLLFLARVALKAKLWGEARAHLADLLKNDPSSVVYSLLATLELEENQNQKTAIAWLEKGMKAPRVDV